jgi:hypothetical protein
LKNNFIQTESPNRIFEYEKENENNRSSISDTLRDSYLIKKHFQTFEQREHLNCLIIDGHLFLLISSLSYFH